MAQGFAFLVARGRHTGFRTLLAPGFLVEQDLHQVLAEATGASRAGGDETRIVEVDSAAVGPFSLGYTSEPVARAEIEPSDADGRELLEDEHGRALEIVYGVVCRAELPGPLNVEDLRIARADAVQRYRSFLTDETAQRVELSNPFELHSNTRERGDTTSRAGGPEPATGEAGGTSARRKWWPTFRAAAAIAIVLALAVTGALIALDGPEPPTVTVYSSLPLHGAEGSRSAQMVRGMQLALQRADGKAGRFEVKYESLDDSPGSRGWTRQAVADNARKAADDARTAVYLGDLDSAASAVSIPILSGSRIAQISPGNTAVGLTTDETGANGGEPDKHYVGGFRNYARIVPRDTIQARALAAVSRNDGCSRVAIVRSQDAGLGDSLMRAMTTQDRRPVLDAVVASGGKGDAAALAQRVADRRANCAIFTGGTSAGAVEIFTRLARAMGASGRLYGTDRLATGAFTDAAQGGLPERVAARVKLTLAAPATNALAVKGLSFTAPATSQNPSQRNPGPYAIFGYEAMSLALDAIERSRTASRQDVVKALFDTKRRRSVLGTYSIDRNGDTTLTDHGVFAIRRGALTLEGRIRPWG